MRAARYDGHADWYDKTFRSYSSDAGSAGLLARLLGPPSADDPVCLDIGCGTGLHFAAVQALGYQVIGVDLSVDQLRIAATRTERVINADARHLPLADTSVPAATMTFTHTDLDDFAAAVAEAARVLRPGGKLIYIGLHPCYVSAFADRGTETESRELLLVPGYGDEELQYDATGRLPVRSRVGTRNLTLETFLGAFLAQPGLQLTSFVELDTNMQPWLPGGTDGRVVPWNVALTCRSV